MPLDRKKAQVISIRYDPETLGHVNVTSVFADAEPYIAAATEEDDWHRPHQGVIDSSRGLIRLWWTPGVYALDDKTENESWKEYVERWFCDPYLAIMDTLYQLHFGDGD